MRRLLTGLSGVALLLGAAGCTSRGITVTSVPEGAEVSINRRVVGKTPIRVAFTHYGTYRLELRKENYQVLVREETVHPPAYGYDPGAFVADNLIPARLNDEVYLHFVMKPLEERPDKEALADRDALLQRAELARAGTVTNPQTGEQMQIAIVRAPSKKTLAEAAPGEEVATSSEVASRPIIDKPLELQPLEKDIGAPQPEGPRLAKQYGVEAGAPDKRGAFVAPEETRPTATRVIRTPKDEELIYAPAPPVDSGTKKAGAAERKNAK